jgi:hypothetical protein
MTRLQVFSWVFVYWGFSEWAWRPRKGNFPSDNPVYKSYEWGPFEIRHIVKQEVTGEESSCDSDV